MAYHFIDENILTDIADAIRSKTGSQAPIEGEDMATEIENIPSGGGGQYNVLCFTAAKNNSTISIRCSIELNIKLQYSYDNSNWNDWGSSISDNYDVFNVITLTSIGNKVYIRGDNATMAKSTSIYSTFIFTGKISASGSIQSLLTYDASYNGVPVYCYYYLFNNCSALTTAPELPATTLSTYCYGNMFYSCTGLTTAPELPATTLAEYCYNNMFYGCSALTTAPELPATTLAQNCYRSMFQACIKLTAAPTLPATSLTQYCYYYMFQNCKALTTAPELPATILASYCYGNMFQNCTALTTASDLPATILAQSCYQYMFAGCTSLTTAPDLPAIILAQGCYQYMFQNCTALLSSGFISGELLINSCFSSMFSGCTKLKKVSIAITNWNTSYTSNWLQNVASSGTFIKPAETTVPTGTNGIPSGWTSYEYDISYNYNTKYVTVTTTIPNATIYYTTDGSIPTTESNQYSEPFSIDLGDYGKTIKVLISANTDNYIINKRVNNYFYVEAINTTNVKYNGQANSFQYSLNNCVTWTNYSNNTNVSVTSGNKIYFRKYTNIGYINTSGGSSYCFTFSSNVNVGGCLSSLSHGETVNGIYKCGMNGVSYLDGGGRYLFYNATTLKSAENLIINLENSGASIHQYMFSGCSTLTKAPKLPATTLAVQCYQYMFYGCAALTTAPALPATTLAANCYYYMFTNCTSLTTAPTLPATTLATSCYQFMFYGCTSLTTAPALPATTLAANCYYYMFQNCASLTTAPDLPATILASSCYTNMFQYCANLNYVKVYAISWSTSSTSNWLQGVAASGTFVKPAGTTIPTGTNGIPAGWTVQPF